MLKSTNNKENRRKETLEELCMNQNFRVTYNVCDILNVGILPTTNFQLKGIKSRPKNI